MTTAKGSYSYCGGTNFTLSLTCSGTNCTQLEGILGMTCSNNSNGVQCSNSVVCPGTPNMTSSFLMQHSSADATVTQTQNVTISNMTFIFSGTGTNISYINGTMESTSQRSSTSSRRFSGRLATIRLLLTVFVLLFTTTALAQSSNPTLDELNSVFNTLIGPSLLLIEEELCKELAGETIHDRTGAALIDAELAAGCLTKVAVAELASGGGELAIALDPALFAAITAAYCWTFILVVVSEVFALAASPLCQAVNSAISGENPSSANPTSANPSQPTSSSLATIPVISGTGPSQCMLCWLNSYFMDLNVSTLSYCNPPQLDYYVPAKYLVRYFCDPSVSTIEPFESMCTAACINPCQQYSLDTWIQTEGTAVEGTWDNDFCGDLCTTIATVGDCPVSQSQWSHFCNGYCPGADEGCSVECGV
jgi:hypothetical protein